MYVSVFHWNHYWRITTDILFRIVALNVTVGKPSQQVIRCLIRHVMASFCCYLCASIIDRMKTSSNGNIFRVTGHLYSEFTGPGEFHAQRPVTRSFDVSFDVHPNKRLSKLWWGWWFETSSCPLWGHRNVILQTITIMLLERYAVSTH